MNQILEYSPNKNSGGGSSGSDKIVRVFAIILFIFALCFLAVGGYGFLSKNKPSNNDSSQTSNQAEITITKLETTALIKVRHNKAIEKIIYSWDNERETVEKGDGTSEKEVEVQLPEGEHTLTVKVIDVDGIETSRKEQITSETGTDIVNPVITIDVTEEKKIKITATDETEIAYVTYKWNDEEEIRKEDRSEDKKTIEFEIDTLKGSNDLTVVAVDANNRTTVESRPFKGVTKPEVKIVVAQDKKSIHVECTHENGLKTVTLFANDQELPVRLPEGEENPKEIQFDFDQIAQDANTKIKVVAVSIDETTTEVSEEIVPNEPEEQENHMNENIIIEIEKIEGDNKNAIIRANYVEGIKEVKLNVNDNDYDVGGVEGNPDNIEISPLPLVQGNNKITVTVIGSNNTENTKVVELQGE